MPRVYTRKYKDFTESLPTLRRAKHPPYEETEYVDITCPYCETVCIELQAKHLQTAKAGRCLQHLMKCSARPNVDGSTRTSKRKYTEEEVERKIKAVRLEAQNEIDTIKTTHHTVLRAVQEANARQAKEAEEKTCAAVCASLNLEAPAAKDSHELCCRIASMNMPSVMANIRRVHEMSTCVVCYDRPSNCVMVPCMHRNVCWVDACCMKQAAEYAKKAFRCPTCRIEVKHMLLVT